EIRGDVDGWARVAVRALRGMYVVGAVESRALHALDDSPVTGTTDSDIRELRATLGLELSFGGVGLAAYGTGVRAPQDAGRDVLGDAARVGDSAERPHRTRRAERGYRGARAHARRAAAPRDLP